MTSHRSSFTHHHTHRSSFTGNIAALLDDCPADAASFLATAVNYTFTHENPAPPHRMVPDALGSAEKPSLSPFGSTIVRVIELDCVDAAMALVKTGHRKVGILNMANEYNCGGGFERVDGSQEEYLFRRTSVALSLFPRRRVGDNRWSYGCQRMGSPTAETTLYPFTKYGGVLSPYVDIISNRALVYVPTDVRVAETNDVFERVGQKCEAVTNSELRDHASAAAAPAEGKSTTTSSATEISAATSNTAVMVVDPTTPLAWAHRMCMLSIAAQDLRPRSYNRGEHWSTEITTEKLRTLFHMAVDAGCDALVLGAIGCGAFKNPALGVAGCFRTLLEGEFRNTFAAVDFAVIKSKTNLEAFERVFGDTAAHHKKAV